MAFDCPTGPTDLLNGGRDGILVREMTSEALAEALGTAMSDGNLRHELRGRAEIAAARCAPDRVVSMWCEVLGIPSITPRTV